MSAWIGWFSSPQECLERLAAKPCDLLIVDLDGCEQEGLDVLACARHAAPWVSTLAIVGQGTVSCAIRAVRAGAGDCLEKPLGEDQLVAAVRTQLACATSSVRRRAKALTPMEIRVLQLILAGRTSHEMAAELRRSKRTIDVHRKSIMGKLQAGSLAEVIKRAIEMGFTEDPGCDESAEG
jgi:FixJ family two-component response regulator